MLIGDEIKRIRIERGMTQQELANLCGLSRTYISHIESNKKSPNMDTINKLLEGMGVEMKIGFVEVIPVSEIQRQINKQKGRPLIFE